MLSKKVKINIFIAIIALVISIGSVVPVTAGFFCGGIGTGNLEPKAVSPALKDAALLPDEPVRDFSYDELFSPAAYGYSIPFGLHEGSWLWRRENTAVKDNATNLSSDATEKLTKYESDRPCMAGFEGFIPSIQSHSMFMTRVVSNAIRGLITSVFNSKFICDDPANPQNGCVNLLKIFGGTGQAGDGIIGNLSKGFFMPMAVIAFLAVAAYIFYKGIIKREFRASFAGLGWALMVFVLGIFTMQKPWMVARAPHVANSVVSSCIISAMNGESCLSNNAGNMDDSFVSPVCKSMVYSSKDLNTRNQMQLGSLTCMVSKGFTIDRWAEQQFGYAFDELYTVNPPNGKKAYPSSKLEGSPEDYCVNMSSGVSPNEMMQNADNIQTIPTKRVCNIALAYMSNRTFGDYGTKAKMGDIIATATKDDIMWAAFTGNGRDLFGTFGLLGAIAAAVSFVPVTLYAHAYSLSATFLMVFAPIFLLLGLHPGRGRRIFLGWLQSVASSIMKFIASCLLILVMVIVYSQVMSEMSGAMTFIACLILCFTFMSYRKELVNLIGVVDMGGAKISNKVGEALEEKGKKAGRVGTAVAGGAIGGAIASKVAGESALKGMGQGVKTGASLEMRRGSGMIAHATRSQMSVKKKLVSEREKIDKEKREEQQRVEANETMKQTASDMGTKLDQRALYDAKQDLDKTNKMGVRDSNLQQQITIYNNENLKEGMSAQEINLNYTRGINMVSEARTIQDIQKESNGDKSYEVEKYIGDFMREEKTKLLQDIQEIQKDENIDKTFGNTEKQEIVSKYLVEQQSKLEEIEKQLRDNIKVNKDINGVENVVINLENLADIKNERAIDNNERTRRYIEEQIREKNRRNNN